MIAYYLIGVRDANTSANFQGSILAELFTEDDMRVILPDCKLISKDAGEIIFLLLWMWAATGVTGAIFGGTLALLWAIFHILIVVLQAYIFMMLTTVYMAMAHEGH